MSYIYLITSPSNKVYVGQSQISVDRKKNSYRKSAHSDKTNRKIINAIQKYGWDNMKFEVIDENIEWTKEELDVKEIYWISYYDSVTKGYNMTIGGDGVDSAAAKLISAKYWANITKDKLDQRRVSASSGQLKRYAEVPDSEVTKKRKSDSHKGSYIVESPDGRIWTTYSGLKDFAELHKDELQMTFWQLFSAYKRCYNKDMRPRRVRKDNNNWKVTRIDKPNN